MLGLVRQSATPLMTRTEGEAMTIRLTDMLDSMRDRRSHAAPTTSGDEITGGYLRYAVLHDEWSNLLRSDDDLPVSLPLENIDPVRVGGLHDPQANGSGWP